MSNRAKFKYNVEQDLIDYLVDDLSISSTIVFHRQTLRDDDDDTLPNVDYPCYAVGAINSRSSLDGGQVPSGFWQLDIYVEVMTYADSDKDKSQLHTNAGLVREGLLQDDILSLLTAKSTYNTYYGILWGDDEFEEDDEKIQTIVLNFSLIFGANLTTTTTTT